MISHEHQRWCSGCLSGFHTTFLGSCRFCSPPQMEGSPAVTWREDVFLFYLGSLEGSLTKLAIISLRPGPPKVSAVVYKRSSGQNSPGSGPLMITQELLLLLNLKPTSPHPPTQEASPPTALQRTSRFLMNNLYFLKVIFSSDTSSDLWEERAAVFL